MAESGANPRLVLDNRVNVSSSFDQLINYSGVNVNTFEIKPDGNSPYLSQILYNNIVVPNISSTLVSRNFRHRYTVQIQYDTAINPKPNFAGVDDTIAAGSSQLSVNPANPQAVDTVLRSPFPLQSVCTSTSLTINSGTTNLASRQVLDPICRRLDPKYLMYQMTECPTMLDNQCVLSTDSGLDGGNAALAIANVANWAAVVDAGVISTNITTPQGVVVPVLYYPQGIDAPAVGTQLRVVAPFGYNATAIVRTAYVANAANPNFGQIYLYKGSGSVSGQPLSAYQNCQGQFTRASFLPISASKAGTIVTVKFNVVESVCLSPLTLLDNETFLANVNTLSLLFNYSTLNDILYTAAGNAASNPVANNITLSGGVQITDASLLLTYIQCNPNVMTIPRSVNYNYENVVYFAKGQTAAAAVSLLLSSVSSDTVRFQCMPSMIYIFVRNPVANRTSVQTQTFYQIGQVNNSSQTAGLQINIGNRTGLLASASPQTLYRISRANGYNGSWNQWNTSGAVLCLNPVKDLGVDPSLDTLPLETGSVNFQVSGTWNASNLLYAGAPTDIAPELMIVAVYAGVATITTDQCMFNLGSLSGNEVNAVLAGGSNMISSEHVQPTVQAAGLFGKSKHILGKMASKHMRKM
jgi:hypothetical protein